ncbi:MAG: PP2C family serine/threonine-protein phosphatase [bacterium]
MIYKVSLPNLLYGHLMPPEDSMLVEGKIFCVADGITRDPTSPKDFTNLSIEESLKNYPSPSGARFAADIFCESFVKSLNKKVLSLNTVRNAFIFGNKQIAKLNKKSVKKVDYLVNDFFGCVASSGVIYNSRLFWAGICDCGIIVYNKNGKIKFQTPNWMKPFEEYEKLNLQKRDFNFAMPKYRKMIRSEYRNNAKKIVENKCVSYGALTGEKEAEMFMNFGEIGLSKGDLVVFYTDGFEATMQHKKFFKTIYHNTESLVEQAFVPFSLSLAKEDYNKFGKERTLIAVIN